jgi:hypothetical protein
MAQLVLDDVADRADGHINAPGTLPIGRPYVSTADGVHAISAPPDEVVHANAAGHALLGDLQQAIGRRAGDAQLAELCRSAVEACGVGYQHERGEDATAALASFLTRARVAYSLISVDLGVGDQQPLRPLLEVADLHVLVVAARREDLECVRARLIAQPRLASREALLAWVPPGASVRKRDLWTLSQERGCPLVKWPTVAWKADWSKRVGACAQSLETLCRLLP